MNLKKILEAQIKISLTFFIILLAVSTSQGQQENKSPDGNDIWTIRECIDYALENNLTVQRGLLSVENSAVNVRQSRLAMTPNLNAGFNYGNNWGRTIDPTTNLFTTDRVQSTNLAFSSNWQIWQTNQLRNSYKQAVLDYEASQADLEFSKNGIILDVIGFYTNVVFNKELVNNAKAQLESTKQQLDRTQKQVNAGAVPIRQQLDLEAQLANNESDVINSENNYTLSLLQLKQLLLIPADQPFEIVIPEIDLAEYALIDQNSSEIFEIAYSTMPEIKSAELGVQSSELGIKVAKAFYYPSLSLNASINTFYSSARDGERIEFVDGTIDVPPFQIGTVNNDPGQPVFSLPSTRQATQTFEDYRMLDQWNDNFGQSVTLNLSVPIYNRHQVKSNVQRAIIQNEQANILAQERKQTLRQTIERAYNDVLAASKSYEQSVKQVQAQEESFRTIQTSYNLGAANFVDFQVAQNNLFLARTNLLISKYDYIFKQKILDFYRGVDLGF